MDGYFNMKIIHGDGRLLKKVNDTTLDNASMKKERNGMEIRWETKKKAGKRPALTPAGFLLGRDGGEDGWVADGAAAGGHLQADD